MISITNKISNYSPILPVHNYKFTAGISQQAHKFKEDGNEYLKINKLTEAIECYKKAIAISPNFTDAYFNLGKAYIFQKDYNKAIKALETASKLSPKDNEITTTLAEAYKNNGQYSKATKEFEKAFNTEKNSDYIKRNLSELENLSYAIFNPQKAFELKQKQAQDNLNSAINIVKKYLPKNYLASLSDVAITFDSTEQMGGRNNIAQYEHAKRKITITADYIWANPHLICAYLVHEFVHAKDNDPYTSIIEEQDAYTEAAKFWQTTSKKIKPPIKDPEMDYVLELYNQSPQSLKDRVAEIYKLRDPNIATTSPNHPPSNNLNTNNLQNTTNSQPLKSYNIIA